MNVFDKIWATYLAIATGWGIVDYMFNSNGTHWSLIGTIIYFLLFLAALYQIKTQQSVFDGYREYRKKRREWREDPNNWSA